MSLGMLSTGLSGLRVAQMGLQVTQHNITNVNSQGFSRQYIQQSPSLADGNGSGYFGTGATVNSVRRSYSLFLAQQSMTSQTRASEAEALSAKLGQLDNMFGDLGSGLTPALQEFFKGVNEVAANPSLTSARQSMLSASELLVNRFNALGTRLDELHESLNGEIGNEIQLVNSYAQQIAQVNYQITLAEAANGQPPNDLLDMRDKLVSELNTHIKVSTVKDSTGKFNVFIGSGQQLVMGTAVNELAPMNSSTIPGRVLVGIQGQSGTPQELPESLIEGGVLGGLLKFRSQSLDYANNKLGMVAASLALTFNAQHALGQDLDGLNATNPTEFQADYFKLGKPRVSADSSTANAVTASFLPPELGPDGNFISRLNGSDYTLRQDDRGLLTFRRMSDGKVWSASGIDELNSQIQGEGFKLDENPVPTANVEYLVGPTRAIALSMALNPVIAANTAKIAAATPATGGVTDSSNAIKLAALQIQKTSEAGAATLQQSYASLVSKIGNDTRQAKLTGEAQQALFEQNEAARSAVSSVNLDEEAANLIKYQQAYQASARVLDIGSKLFDSLLSIAS